MARAESPLPEWVAEANRRLRARALLPRPEPSRRPPGLGDLCLAEPIEPGGAEPVLVCVTEVDRELATVRAVLASPETELATRSDLLVAAAESGLPFDLVLESEVSARLWWLQVERRVARLGPELAARLRDAVQPAAGVASPNAHRTPASAGGAAGAGLRRLERARLDALASGCEQQSAGGRRCLPLVVDPLLLVDPPGADAGARLGRIEAIAGALATAESSLLPGGAAAVLEAWDAGGRGRDPAIWRALQPCLERALAAPPAAASPAVEFTPPRAHGPPWADEALAAACGELLRGGARSIRLLTARRAWSREAPDEPAAVAAVRLAGGGALQLIRHHLEVNP
jgi:hypothetical protein